MSERRSRTYHGSVFKIECQNPSGSRGGLCWHEVKGWGSGQIGRKTFRLFKCGLGHRFGIHREIGAPPFPGESASGETPHPSSGETGIPSGDVDKTAKLQVALWIVRDVAGGRPEFGGPLW